MKDKFTSKLLWEFGIRADMEDFLKKSLMLKNRVLNQKKSWGKEENRRKKHLNKDDWACDEIQKEKTGRIRVVELLGEN